MLNIMLKIIKRIQGAKFDLQLSVSALLVLLNLRALAVRLVGELLFEIAARTIVLIALARLVLIQSNNQSFLHNWIDCSIIE